MSERYWGAMLHTKGRAGMRVGVRDITYNFAAAPTKWEIDEYEVVSHLGGGELHLYLTADTEEEALQIAAHRFCQAVGVWDMKSLFEWASREHREQIARREQTRQLPPEHLVAEPIQATLF